MVSTHINVYNMYKYLTLVYHIAGYKIGIYIYIDPRIN